MMREEVESGQTRWRGREKIFSRDQSEVRGRREHHPGAEGRGKALTPSSLKPPHMRREHNLDFHLCAPPLLFLLSLVAVAPHIHAHADVLCLGDAMHVEQAGQPGVRTAGEQREQRRQVLGADVLGGEERVEQRTAACVARSGGGGGAGGEGEEVRHDDARRGERGESGAE